MNLTERQQGALALTAVGLGAVLMARAWRNRRAYDFAGKVVVITGGSRGLGLIMARELAREGARLVLIARDEADLGRAADDLRAHQSSVEVVTIGADVRNRHDAERAVAQVVDRFGGVDVLVNNAGIIQVGPLDHMKLSDYEDAMNTHFWGPLYMVLASLPHMRRRRQGRIVNISSIGGKISVPHLVPYCASKFALAGLSDGLRAELSGEGIVVTTVFPGLMRTGSPVNAMFKGKWPQEYAWFAISDSLPLASIDATRAARQIIGACRHGEAELTITVQARMAVLAHDLAPELFADAMALMNRLLPAPTGHDGDHARAGRNSESRWAPSPLTTPTYEAAHEHNQDHS
jgi:NAD(P)-dependent dehydrogenase (short-subunit alcohol dehydrogenase family)